MTKHNVPDVRRSQGTGFKPRMRLIRNLIISNQCLYLWRFQLELSSYECVLPRSTFVACVKIGHIVRQPMQSNGIDAISRPQCVNTLYRIICSVTEARQHIVILYL